MQKLKNFLLKEYVLVFLFSLAIIQGPAFSLIDNYDQSTNVDCGTYMGIARLDFNQSPVRRYRPLVPLAAGAINYTLGPVFNKLKPLSFPGDFPLALSFLIVNNILISILGVLIYRFCKSYGISTIPALGGLVVMLTCRWTPYIAGIALVDSLYCIVVALVLLGISEKNNKLTLLAIFLGPFAKESFIFVAPLIFFFSAVPKGRQLVFFMLSGLLVFLFRYLYDHLAGFPPDSGLAADIYHFNYVAENVRKLFSFHGVYDILSNFGLWLFLPLGAWLWLPAYRQALKQRAGWYMLVFMIIILVHMLLSGYFERMVYLSMPLLCMVTALAVEEIKKQYFPSGK